MVETPGAWKFRGRNHLAKEERVQLLRACVNKMLNEIDEAQEKICWLRASIKDTQRVIEELER